MAKGLESIIKANLENVWHHLTLHTGSAPMIAIEAKGMHSKDIHGNEYLDATSGGVWRVSVGYGRE